ncbi:GGDEF domain-containing protein [Vibrio sp. SCSIO 43136]|uniref:GGDEF domain-containing protein n=1 Tax=Vibrio sp. SCSIO 43136 TaxID=2819101 RepID=UPI002075256A|nr:GGDEF domain-containing protein [Vibrio sp. SCSIO 43136]USD67910.1 GGDEF domain-containing protein [Vibrio sp. SCSIO 43136]
MDAILTKVSDAGLDPASVQGEDAIIFWDHVRQHIATNNEERAHCYAISSQYRVKLKQPRASIDELRAALELLSLPEHAEDVLNIRASLAEQLFDGGDYALALKEYVMLSTMAVEFSEIDFYVIAVMGMGNLCDAYGDHHRALKYYMKIDGIDHAISSRTLRLRYKLYMVSCLISVGRLVQAEEKLRECEELSILVSDKILAGQIILYQARIQGKQKNHLDALKTLTKARYSLNNTSALWLSNMMRLELARNLNGIGRMDLAEAILYSMTKRLEVTNSPVLMHKLYDVISGVLETQQEYKRALAYQKHAYRIHSDLVKNIPISELAGSQLRRLTRFELQLKLIMSEQENRELKETTETQKSAVAKLQQDVFTDPLTSLHNRRWLDVKLKDLLLHNTNFALMVIDIDHFKSINDELSHLVGDKAIVNVATELKSHFRFKGSSCVRFGGEEFLVILENANIEQAVMHAEHYRERIFQFSWLDILGERGLTVSVGVTLHKEGENTQRTFYRADKALYRAKAKGRNQVCYEV